MMTPPIRKKPPVLFVRAAHAMDATMRAFSPTTGAEGNPNLCIESAIEHTISRHYMLTLGI
jgi:hypothetical protein